MNNKSKFNTTSPVDIIYFLQNLNNGNNKYWYKSYYDHCIIYKDDEEGRNYQSNIDFFGACIMISFLTTIFACSVAMIAHFSVLHTWMITGMIGMLPTIGLIVNKSQYEAYKKSHMVMRFNNVYHTDNDNMKLLMNYANGTLDNKTSASRETVYIFVNNLIKTSENIIYTSNSNYFNDSKFVNISKNVIDTVTTDDKFNKDYEELAEFYNMYKNKFSNNYNFEKLLKTYYLSEYMNNADFNKYKIIVDELLNISRLVIDANNTKAYSTMDNIINNHMNELNSIIINIGQNQYYKSFSSGLLNV